MNERVFLPHKKKKLTSFQIIILGFLGVILLGTVFLMLPVSTRAGTATPFSDALFTSTSAVCVTGLVMHDTATYWSFFGQVVILFLIQIGGLGVITVAASFAMISGKKISLMQRSTMQEAIAAPKVGGIVRLTNFMIRTTLAIELLGTIIMGTTEAFSSLTGYASEPVVNLTIMSLIIIGGIGFLTWDDLRANRLHWQKYRMQSKVILCTTAVLLIVPAIYFFFFEFSALEPGKRILCSLFQSVTPRTAGFNTVDLTSLRESGQAIIILLMLIGGSPGSTAGGMKTTTVAVLFATALSTFRRKEDTHFFGRRIEDGVVKNAATIGFLYVALFLFGGLAISMAEGLPMLTCLFETASAVGTVGLSLGITPGLGILSRVILILLMFFGRVGGLTLIFAALSGTQKQVAKLPLEKITVG